MIERMKNLSSHYDRYEVVSKLIESIDKVNELVEENNKLEVKVSNLKHFIRHGEEPKHDQTPSSR